MEADGDMHVYINFICLSVKCVHVAVVGEGC